MNNATTPTGAGSGASRHLIQLRSFEAVARLGGVGRAAKALHLAQSTVHATQRVD